MSSRFNIFKEKIWILCLLGLLVACQDTIPKRSTISQGSNVVDPIECPEGQVLVTEPAEDTPTNESGDQTEEDTSANVVQICKDKPVTRPDKAVLWKTDFCICKDSKPVSYGNCAAFCSDKNTSGEETLFANFRVTEDIALSGLGSVHGWCNAPLPTDTSNPKCELQAKDDKGNVSKVEITMSANSNSLTANVKSSLAFDKTYVLTLVETVSGAKSDSVQIVKLSTDTTVPILGPLKNAPISQYTCMLRELSQDTTTGDIYFESAYRIHFYFLPRIPPDPIPAGNSNVICHDIFNPLFGPVDQELFPRFEQEAGTFNLWDLTDPRFYDNNQNEFRDVNDLIVQKTKNFGGSVPADSEFFQAFIPLYTQNRLLATNVNDNTVNQGSVPDDDADYPLGFYMFPWIDQNTFKAYCPNSTHYNSNNALFRALGEVLQTDTEALYLGVKAAETVIDNSGNATSGLTDVIYIRETDLKAVWFYLKNGVPTAPTEDNVSNSSLFFYYPLNKISPFVKTSTQRIYRVRSFSELADAPAVDTSAKGQLPTHDRRIGCIPKF